MKVRFVLPLLIFSLAISASAEKPETETPAEKPAKVDSGKVRDVTPDEVEKLMKDNPELVILDVRTPDEFEMGHLPGAINDSVLALDFVAKLPSIEGRQIVLHCASGSRSKRALTLLKEKNFTTIYHMNGGYKAWKEAGKTVVGDKSAAK